MRGAWLAFTLRQPCKERLAERWLGNAGFACVLPVETRKQRKRHGDRSWVTVKRLALPGYIFVRVPTDQPAGDVIANARNRVAILGRPVGAGGKPLLLGDGWETRLELDPEGLTVPAYIPARGAKIRITGSVMAIEGYSGLVESVTGREVRVIIEALHRAITVTMPLHAVRAVAA